MRMTTRRTTITANVDALASLEAEAARRHTSLSAIVAEAIEEKARLLRERARPRVGVARSTDGLSAADVGSKPVARPPR